ncbi:ABC transporter, ATP-binding protein [Pyramidobacter piscolens W5455]|uniref:ABC transporter, ATP-binding protein n=1 Tax=Pyramidobacter piscolens W5455 TaxID=352165 RepID=A0ABP2HRC5_9BACT|nr:amino acid ABC transporter ATP-binding protein [Pyramidobacter piscolens]EFB89907.1 ABC transporter, ATP-binding protein [Pyramidobacter piscolens W5455]BDF79511.1 ABC transporter ATP-binding protein [Pyramidobacter piscolens]
MLEISHLKKSYNGQPVLRDVNLTLAQGEVMAVIGPSGTGKSTLLRCVNFLERPESGTITLDGLTVDAARATQAQIHALRRQTAMVFQNYNLLRNLTALENVMEPMVTVQRLPRVQARRRALELLDKVGLADKADFYPRKMSGGQQQRVGIARAMGGDAKVILFDEPTSSLDPELIGEVLAVIRQLAEEHTTMVIVTHEMKFAREVADTMIFLEDGIVAGEGTPEEIFERCGNERIRRFVHRVMDQ